MVNVLLAGGVFAGVKKYIPETRPVVTEDELLVDPLDEILVHDGSLAARQ